MQPELLTGSLERHCIDDARHSAAATHRRAQRSALGGKQAIRPIGAALMHTSLGEDELVVADTSHRPVLGGPARHLAFQERTELFRAEHAEARASLFVAALHEGREENLQHPAPAGEQTGEIDVQRRFDRGPGVHTRRHEDGGQRATTDAADGLPVFDSSVVARKHYSCSRKDSPGPAAGNKQVHLPGRTLVRPGIIRI
ncbi:MAG: hypothetical protein BWY75_03722 [bacterium ADurb.Bin425]|nr:MAG: hypothetical protein BWY75_03722 [bacterium ADurb.Bin425]